MKTCWFGSFFIVVAILAFPERAFSVNTFLIPSDIREKFARQLGTAELAHEDFTSSGLYDFTRSLDAYWLARKASFDKIRSSLTKEEIQKNPEVHSILARLNVAMEDALTKEMAVAQTLKELKALKFSKTSLMARAALRRYLNANREYYNAIFEVSRADAPTRLAEMSKAPKVLKPFAAFQAAGTGVQFPNFDVDSALKQPLSNFDGSTQKAIDSQSSGKQESLDEKEKRETFQGITTFENVFNRHFGELMSAAEVRTIGNEQDISLQVFTERGKQEILKGWEGVNQTKPGPEALVTPAADNCLKNGGLQELDRYLIARQKAKIPAILTNNKLDGDERQIAKAEFDALSKQEKSFYTSLNYSVGASENRTRKETVFLNSRSKASDTRLEAFKKYSLSTLEHYAAALTLVSDDYAHRLELFQQGKAIKDLSTPQIPNLAPIPGVPFNQYTPKDPETLQQNLDKFRQSTEACKNAIKMAIESVTKSIMQQKKPPDRWAGLKNAFKSMRAFFGGTKIQTINVRAKYSTDRTNKETSETSNEEHLPGAPLQNNWNAGVPAEGQE